MRIFVELCQCFRSCVEEYCLWRASCALQEVGTNRLLHSQQGGALSQQKCSIPTSRQPSHNNLKLTYATPLFGCYDQHRAICIRVIMRCLSRVASQRRSLRPDRSAAQTRPESGQGLAAAAAPCQLVKGYQDQSARCGGAGALRARRACTLSAALGCPCNASTSQTAPYAATCRHAALHAHMGSMCIVTQPAGNLGTPI